MFDKFFIMKFKLLALIIMCNCFSQIQFSLAQNASKKFIDAANFDMTSRPGDNFYKYANGNWQKNNPIPATESRWGSFNELQEFNLDACKKLLESAASKHQKKGALLQKIGDFYKSGMDTIAIEKAGMTPLLPFLERVNKIKTKEDIINELAEQHKEGIGPLFSFYVYQDDKNSTAVVPQFQQGGLGMPDKDYYTKSDERTLKIRNAYKDYITRMFELIGTSPSDAAQIQGRIFEFEKSLASKSSSRVELRDPVKNYNKLEIPKFQSLLTNINANDFLNKLGASYHYVLVGQPAFFEAINTKLVETSVEDWKIYLKWNVLRKAAGYLSDDFVKTQFNYSKALSGQKEQKERWKRVLAVVDDNIGELLGQEYVKQHFKPEAKKRMLELVDNLARVFEKRIKGLDWMSESTKKKAELKLHAFMRKIGYPDKWRDYSKLHIGKVYWENVVAANKFSYQYMVRKLNRPVDRTEWLMSPPTVNAYYNPSLNEIVFPAGILQFPFFDNAADDAFNYGGIGAVIGHEMTHGFDDQGRQYDAQGNLSDWWTEEDAAKFKAKTDVVVQQFNQYKVLDSLHVNGELTLGENIADLGGLSIAYEAFKNTPQGKSEEKIDGFTGDQRFFLAWAQVWRQNIRDEELANRIVVDPHSPGEFRTNGPLSNMPEFYKAFNVKSGYRLWRPENERAKVW